MRTPARIWTGFGIAAAAVIAAIAGLSVVVLKLEARAERERARKAAVEQMTERVQEALWRLDAYVVPVMGQQAAFAYSNYMPAFVPNRLYTVKGKSRNPDRVLLEISPILTTPWPEWVLLHFQAPVSGGIASPQIPEGRYAWVNDAAEIKPTVLKKRKELLQKIRSWLNPRVRLALAERSSASKGTRELAQRTLTRRYKRTRIKGKRIKKRIRVASADHANRRRYFQRGQVQRQMPETAKNIMMNAYQPPRIVVTPGWGSKAFKVEVGQVTTAWISTGDGSGPQLVLYRLATVKGKRYIQGSLLDWPLLRKALTAEIDDLFKRVELVPVPDAGSGPAATAPPHLENRMSTLPVALKAGPIAAATFAWNRITPIRTVLLFAWALALMALVATGLAVRGTSELAKRRVNFVSAVSHELRTPLTAFRMYLDMLAEGMIPEEEKRAETLRKLQGQAERLSGLVRGVLDYSRLERKTFSAHKQTADPNKLFADLEQAARDRCNASGVQLETTKELPESLSLQTDPEAVNHVVLNLVDNACKYAGTGPDRCVRLSARTEADALVIRVADNGPGIPRKARRKLFQAFYRAENEMTREHQGVGLGLAIARGLSTACGAKLELAGKPREDGNIEAVFELRLPLGR